MEPLICVSPT
jgi:hypothetical protein